MKKIAFIVNGGKQSAMGYRARALAERLRERYDIHLAYREGKRPVALLSFFKFLRSIRPQAAYVFDMSYAGVLGAWLYRLFFGGKLIIETGDAIYELMRSTGNRGRVGLWLTHRLEKFSLRAADRIVVRGSFHRELLARMGVKADLIQDGVDTQEFAPLDAGDLRRQHQLDDALTVGLVGSSVWSEKLGMCYGWELIELLRLLPSAPVKGVVIGDGSGIPRLKALCREYGIKDRVLFLGHVPYTSLPRYLNMIDVCLSTQTNDLAGQVRTSGKLPLYLAAGRFVLASSVGEAALVLDEEMLIPYEGVKDAQYPARLARKIQDILAAPGKLERGAENVTVAKEFFEYSKLAQRLSDVIESVLQADREPESAAPPRHERLDSAVIGTSEESK